MTLSDVEFEDAVADALDTIPQRLLDRMENVVILIEAEPPHDQLAPGSTLLGLYIGTPLPDRMDGYGFGSLPDRILIFRGPLTRLYSDPAALRAQIRVTVLHEIGHHFGIDDHRLHELGWG